jgi:hypothetical protein
MRRLLTLMLAVESVAACSPASAVTIDPRNDVHCSVLAFYFHGLAVHDGASNTQIRATKGLQDWYTAKLRAHASGRYADPALLQRELGPILDTIKANPDSMRDAARTCVSRAAADPSFNDFARSYIRQQEVDCR